MADSSSRPNKHYHEQLKQFNRALKEGTREYAIRHAPVPEVACDTPDCLSNTDSRYESYWMCDKCRAKAPDTITTYSHCPTKNHVPLVKRKAANTAAFSAVCLMRKRKRARLDKEAAKEKPKPDVLNTRDSQEPPQ